MRVMLHRRTHAVAAPALGWDGGLDGEVTSAVNGHLDVPAAVLVVAGVSGAGKSSVGRAVAALLGWDFADGDDFHPPANVAKMAAGHALDDADRAPWLVAIAAWIGGAQAAGRGGVVACSALRRSYRDQLAEGHPAVFFCLLTADPDVLAHRLTARHGHFMPASLLDSQLATLEPLGPGERGATFDTSGSPDRVAVAIVDALRAHA
jgi:gluconokinase